jgi:hypothetical protein
LSDSTHSSVKQLKYHRGSHIQIDFKLLYRPFVTSTATPWRQITNIRQVEFCEPLKSGTSFPILQHFIDRLREIIPITTNECPKELPYHFGALNINITDADDDGTLWFQVPLANGIYRHIVKFWNENDTEGTRIEWQSESKFIKNLGVFN